MNTIMEYLLEAGVESTPASWGVVIITCMIVGGVICLLLRLLPRKK